MFLGVNFVVLVLMSIAFTKFRMHQEAVYRPNRIELPRRWYLPSAQACLLVILLIEAGAILELALVLSEYVSPMTAFLVAAVFIIFAFSILELGLLGIRRQIRETLHPKLSEA